MPEDMNSQKHPDGTSYIAFISSLVMIVSVFFPWLGATTSTSIGGIATGGGSVSVSGISLAQGILGILLGVASLILVWKKYQYAALTGFLALVDALTMTFGGIGGGSIGGIGGGSMSGGGSFGGFGVKASVSYGVQWGIYVFIASSVLVLVFTLKNLPSSVKERISLIGTIQKLTDDIEKRLPF